MTDTATRIKERGIRFSGEEVRATLDGRKTQTRRVIKPQPPNASRTDHQHWSYYYTGDMWHPEASCLTYEGDPNIGKWAYLGRTNSGHHVDLIKPIKCPYGKPGDRLWVRETWQAVKDWQEHGEWFRDERERDEVRPDDPICYRATDPNPDEIGWRPSIHMPRWASRILLEITDVRAERVRDITQIDAECEGTSYDKRGSGPIVRFKNLWDSLNAKRGHPWDNNDWVWVITSKPVEGETR